MITKLKLVKNNNYRALVLKDEYNPINVTYTNEQANIIEFENGEKHLGVCVNCNDKPCFQLDDSEINVDVLDGLPFNNDKRVCPNNAISVTDYGIEIEQDSCIACGICSQRCPIGGITVSKENTFYIVNNEISNPFQTISEPNKYLQEDSLRKFHVADKKVEIEKILISTADFIRDSFINASKKISDIELIMIRNFLINLNVNNKISAPGNIDSRMDALGKLENYFLPAQSGLVGDDILGLPRRILEGISYLHARHRVNKKLILPLLFIYIFPRKRSDFYEVIYDIEAITGISVKTIPLHTLYLLNLFQVKLNLKDIQDNFLINTHTQDAGTYIENYIPRIKDIDENYGNELYTFWK